MARQPYISPDSGTTQSSAMISFEANLWLTVNKLRNNVDAAEGKHVVLVLGLIFQRYISDALRYDLNLKAT